MTAPDGPCETCGRPKLEHTEAEAAICIVTMIVRLGADVHVVGP